MVRLKTWLVATADGYAAVIRSPDLRRSQVAWAAAITAEWAFFVGLSVFVFEHGGTVGLGLVGLLRMLPSALAAPFASLLGDRYRRERVALGLFLAMATAVALAAVAASVDPSVVAIYVLAAVHGVASTLSRSAQWTLLPSLSRTPEELVAANGATLTTENIGTLAGPAVAGVVLAASGPATLFTACAVAYLLAAAALARVHVAETSRGAPSAPGLVRELLAGFPALVGDRDRLLIVALFYAQGLVRGALNVFLVVVAVRLLDTGESGVGFLTAALGVGGLVGAVASVSLTGRRLAAPFALGLVLWGLPLVALGAWPEVAAALLLIAVIGAGNSVLDVAGLTLLQRLVPNEVLNRAMGVFWGFAMATIGIGSIITSGLVTSIGARGALAATGALLPILAVLAWPRLLRIDRSVAIPSEQLDALRHVPMFAPLSLVAKEQLAGALRPVSVPAGEDVMREGDHGDRFFIVAEGEVEVSSGGDVVAVRGSHDYFGEIALLRDVPRTATVHAKTDLRLYALGRDEFLAAVTGNAAGMTAGDAVVSERLATLPPTRGGRRA